MNKIAIFYHVYQLNNWLEISNDQMATIQNSGLFNAADYVHIGVNGSQPINLNLKKNHKIKYNSPEYFDGETETMLDLYDFCLTNKEYKVLFLHTKGVTLHNTEFEANVVFWRKYMERFNIDNWKRCCELLNDYDCVGTEWETDMVLGGQSFVSPCYSGTFWWANAEYISKLDRNFLFLNSRDIPGSRRFQCEFWIGTGNPNYYNFYTSNKNKYYSAVLPEEYEQFI